MSTLSENSPWNRLNTCPSCGHYTQSHKEDGCVVMESKYDSSSGKAVWVGGGRCECKRTFEKKEY
jgi:hypothetical protein